MLSQESSREKFLKLPSKSDLSKQWTLRLWVQKVSEAVKLSLPNKEKKRIKKKNLKC